MNPPRWSVLAICVLLAALSWLVFGQTLGHEFLNYDDADYVTKNPHVLPGLTSSGIVWAFSHVYSANWHPLTWISHMLDCQLFGLNPRGHHLTNVLLHSANAVLLFLVLWRMTDALWRSAFVAAVFAIHPLRAESVAWIAERKDVLSGLFFILTLAAYTRYARHPRSIGRYALVLCCFAAGLMAKPMLITLPFVLLLLDYWPLQRFTDQRQQTRTLLLEKIPLFALVAASCAATLFAQTTSIRTLEEFPLKLRMANAAISTVGYVRDMLWPAKLAAFYPFPSDGIAIAKLILALSLVAAVSVAAFLLRDRPYFFTGWFWYLIMLAPVIGIIQVGDQSRADRYTYLPQIGLCIALTWGVADFGARWRSARIFLPALAAIVVIALVFSARAQVALWQNDELLWTQTLARTSRNAIAHKSLGYTFHEKGRLDEALAEYERALEINPRLASARSNLGVTLLQLGRREESLSHLQKALESNPNVPDFHSNLGLALLDTSHVNEALAEFQKALQLNPDLAGAHYNLGNILVELGRAPEALPHYQRVLELDPNDFAALNNLAWLLATSPQAEIRDGKRALELAERADVLTDRRSPIVAATLAAAYAESGRFAEAVKSAERALNLAMAEGNAARAESIRQQLEQYRAGSPFRDLRNPATTR
ncbi:MAG: tetratricopeptide repeat protein [Chthoniobacterales bacterium]